MTRRIVFPTNQPDGLLSKRGAHFGRADFYTLVDVDANGNVTDVTVAKNPGHESGGCGNAVENICRLDATALVVSGIGGAPLKGFTQRGMTVYFDNASATVQDALSAFLSGALVPMTPEQSCSHH